jgi:hypothetical protein
VSPRTRELAELLGRVIDEYEKHHPEVSDREIYSALSLASRNSRASLTTRRRVLVVALGMGVLAAGLGVFAQLRSDHGEAAVPIMIVTLATILAVGVAMLFRAGRGL